MSTSPLKIVEFRRGTDSLKITKVYVSRNHFFLVTMAVFTLFVLACGSQNTTPVSAPPTQTATPVISTVTATSTPGATVTVTVQPPATQTSVPVPTATSVQIAPESVSYPACDTGTRGSGSIGTAPGPTPTPVPNIDTRDPEIARQDLSTYMSAVQPITRYMANASELFNGYWPDSVLPSEQARLLQVLGTRISIACEAIALITEVPPEATGFDALLKESARVRHAWVGAAVEQLLCCGSSVNAHIHTGNTETTETLEHLVDEVSVLLERYNSAVSRDRLLVDSELGIEIVAGEDWIVSADGLSPLLLAPLTQNARSVEGLGPQNWKLGTAVRIRRLRNPTPTTASEASSRFAGLITQHGNVNSVGEISISGLVGLRHELASLTQSWEASVTVVVTGRLIYFIETGCPSNVDGACEAVEAAVESLKIGP